MLRGGVFEARCVQGCLRRPLPLLEGGRRLGGGVLVRCVLLPVPWSGSEALFEPRSKLFYQEDYFTPCSHLEPW